MSHVPEQSLHLASMAPHQAVVLGKCAEHKCAEVKPHLHLHGARRVIAKSVADSCWCLNAEVCWDCLSRC